MDVITFADWGNDAANILSVFDDRVPDREILERDLVADRHVLVDDGAELAVVLGNHAEPIRACGEVLDDYDTDVVAAIMYEHMGYICHGACVQLYRSVIR